MTAHNGVRLLATAVSVGMAVAVIAGLYVVGSPMHQRALRLDALRSSDLSRISIKIKGYWSQHKSLPTDLTLIDAEPRWLNDPISGAPYEYAATGAETYRLCARFDTASEPEGRFSGSYIPPGSDPRWNHPAGKHCFGLDATSSTVTF